MVLGTTIRAWTRAQHWWPLESSRWEDRAVAAEALASTDDADAHAALAALLGDENLAVIRRATA
jgi:HEAT repeat protein